TPLRPAPQRSRLLGAGQQRELVRDGPSKGPIRGPRCYGRGPSARSVIRHRPNVHPALDPFIARFIQQGVIRTMDLSQDALLPILLLTIVANVAIVTVLLASGRLARGKQVATATPHASGFESTIMSSSYDDHATDTWAEPIATASTNGHQA